MDSPPVLDHTPSSKPARRAGRTMWIWILIGAVAAAGAAAAVVMARVRAIEHSVAVHAEPGPARELAVLRDSAAVTGPLALQSRQPVVIRVVARDS